MGLGCPGVLSNGHNSKAHGQTHIWRPRENTAKMATIVPKLRSRAPDGSAPRFFSLTG